MCQIIFSNSIDSFKNMMFHPVPKAKRFLYTSWYQPMTGYKVKTSFIKEVFVIPLWALPQSLSNNCLKLKWFPSKMFKIKRCFQDNLWFVQVLFKEEVVIVSPRNCVLLFAESQVKSTILLISYNYALTNTDSGPFMPTWFQLLFFWHKDTSKQIRSKLAEM